VLFQLHVVSVVFTVKRVIGLVEQRMFVSYVVTSAK